ncbi:MAG TPA: hypothetical protein VLY03_12645 [Bacteroidota bacterium]|nr:hypothetical protein [Bacteroidota bacterium]
MKSKLVLSLIVLVALLISAFTWYGRYQHSYRMVNVGGDTNQCKCTQRLER